MKEKEIPVEYLNTMNIVERYQETILREYKIITTEGPDINTDLALEIAIKSINYYAGPCTCNKIAGI